MFKEAFEPWFLTSWQTQWMSEAAGVFPPRATPKNIFDVWTVVIVISNVDYVPSMKCLEIVKQFV